MNASRVRAAVTNCCRLHHAVCVPPAAGGLQCCKMQDADSGARLPAYH